MKHTHIVLPQMNPLNARRKSNINPIIDQQRHIISASNLVQPLGRLNLDRRVTFLISVLNNGYSWMDISGEVALDTGQKDDC